MRYRYYAIAQGLNGDAISGASVSVYLAGSTTPARVYSGPSGGSGNNTPPQVTTGEDGSFQFWIEANEYSYGQLFKLVIQKDSNSKTVDNVQVVIWDTTPYSIDASGANNNQVVVFNVTSQKLQAGPGVYITSAGRVGIGTTAPATKLSNIASAISDGWASTQGINWQTNADGYVLGIEQLNSTNWGAGGLLVKIAGTLSQQRILSLSNGSGTVFTVKGDGNVGIGTTAPSQKLTVAGNIGLQAGANAFVGTLDNYALVLRTNNTDRVYVTSDGNVGIGVTVPLGKLDVAGAVRGSILSSNRCPVGLEFNILFNATNRYTVSQSGSTSFDLPTLFDGIFIPTYTPDGVNPSNPVVILIENLPPTYTQVGAWVGWTTRFWPPKRFKIEGYDIYNGYNNWRTIADYSSTDYFGGDFITKVPTEGQYTKLKFTIYQGTGDTGANGYAKAGLSELFFIHPEANRLYSGLLPSTMWEVNDNVGIGTKAPGAKLHIEDSSNNTKLRVNKTGGSGLYIGGTGRSEVLIQSGAEYVGGTGFVARDTTSVGLFLSGDGGMRFHTDTGLTPGSVFTPSQRMIITNNGNVGIGTTNPFVKLDLGNNVNPSRVLAVHTDGTNFFYGFGNDNRGGTGYLDFYANSPIGTAGVDVKMTIGHNGNVGIGTTAPNSPLHIERSVNIGGDNTHLRIKQGASGLYGAKLSLDATALTGGRTWEIWSSGGTASEGQGKLVITDRSEVANRFVIDTSGNVGIGTTAPSQKLTVAGNIGLQAGANAFVGTLDNYALALRTNNTNRIYITNGGNVGIGTTSPGSNLDVAGTAQLRGAVGGTGLYVNSAGNVGIGTTVPLGKLEVNGGHTYLNAVGARLRFVDNVVGTGDTDGFFIEGTNAGGSAGNAQLWNFENGYIRFGTNNTERVRIDSTGNVGIGTTSPGEKLDVNGNIQASGQLKSTVATGTAPISVNSTTLCSNLNSDRTDGYHASQTPAANTIPVSDSGGKLNLGWLPANINADTTDGYHASQTPAANTIPVAKSDGKLDPGWLPITGYWEGSGNNIYNTNTGNVGIGVSTPGEKLDVNGNIQASGQLKSTVATGTAPIVVNSTTVCANLNAKLWDGAAKHVSTSDPSGGNDGDMWFKYV